MKQALKQVIERAKLEPKRQYARRSDLHLTRKVFHCLSGLLLLFPYLVLGFSEIQMAAMLACMLALVMSVEYSRGRNETVNKVTLLFLRPIMRDSEVGGISGIPFYIASCLFAFLVFPSHVAVLSVLYLAFGDPSSSFFGILYGRSKLFPNKSLEGTLGGYLVCALVTLVYLQWHGIGEGRFAVLVLLGGFAGSMAELLPLNVDDNFSIPVVSGLFMSLAFWCAGISGV